MYKIFKIMFCIYFTILMSYGDNINKLPNESIIIANESNISTNSLAHFGKQTMLAITSVPFVVGLGLMSAGLANYCFATDESAGIVRFATYPLFIITAPLFIVGFILTGAAFMAGWSVG